MIASLYRRILPYRVRNSVYNLFLGRIVYFFRNFNVIARSKVTYVFGFLLPKNETTEVYKFIGRHGITSYPYPYSLEYKARSFAVERDLQLNLPFVVHNGKRLYFPEFFTNEKVEKDYRALITEQDPRSAHRYVRSYDELKDRTLLDVGAAEGIFSLDTIELTKEVILFEYQDYWQKPLQATFAPWMKKVSIRRNYVSDKTENHLITLDDIFSTRSKDNLFIKMDIEGAERVAVQGASNTLALGKNIQVAICTYHRPGDPEYMETILRKYGFITEFSTGLMYWNKRFSKGVIRGTKTA